MQTFEQVDNILETSTVNRVLADPSVRFWVKEQLHAASKRDLLDALNDAELLRRTLQNALDSMV